MCWFFAEKPSAWVALSVSFSAWLDWRGAMMSCEQSSMLHALCAVQQNRSSIWLPQHTFAAFEVEQEPIHVLGTEEAITEIARNLVENAIGHAPANTEVTIGLSRRGLLSIADRGPGIPKDQRNRLFERFWRGSWTSRPGSGLGLAIVAEACQSIEATVQCLNTPGGGARFDVQFATHS